MVGFLKKYKAIFLIAGGFVLGAAASSGLLLYSGKELVNLLVYFTFIVLLPALFSIFSFISFLFSKKREKEILAFKLSSFGGIFFSLGALLSLILTISTKDIAFGWATTLNLDASALKSLIDKIALWKPFCRSCIPDIHLIELSRYSRLGGAVSKEQIQNALLLGQWWKFLALSILFYGVFLRTLFYIIALFFKIEKIEFYSNIATENFKPLNADYKNIADLDELKSKKFKLIGYHLDTSKLNLQSDESAKNIIVAVKSWEVPIMDFFDFLEELQEQNSGNIAILLTGLNERAQKRDIDIWLRKLKELNLNYKVYK